MELMKALRYTALARLVDFLALIKIPQTALLSITGLCAYTLTRGLSFNLAEAAWMVNGLWLSISGCTVLNMLLDRDIDVRMKRTATRPLPSGRLQPTEAGVFGGVLSALGLALSFGLSLSFGAVILSGFIFDLLVYTAWLKRRTSLSIIFGGIAGGMPALAGRVLALGKVDLIGILLVGSVLTWIPTHILTLMLRYAEDYSQASLPAWPNVYGPRATRLFVAGASLLNVAILGTCALLLRLHQTALALLLGMGLGIFGLAVLQLASPTEKRNWLLFKLASFYMLLSSLLLTLGSLVVWM